MRRRVAVYPDARIQEFLTEQGIDPTRTSEFKITWEAGCPVYIESKMYAEDKTKDGAA